MTTGRIKCSIPWDGDMAEFPNRCAGIYALGMYSTAARPAEATVYYSDIDWGCYIKKARHGALRNEAAMTGIFAARTVRRGAALWSGP